MTDRDKIIDKIQKLKAMADSANAIGSEAEAQAFANMFQKMLLEHRLEMSDIEFQAFEKEQPIEKKWVDYRQYPGMKFKKRRSGWMEDLAGIIARAHFCRLLVSQGSNIITFVGRADDIKVVEYMFVTLVRSVEKMADDAYAKFSIQCVNECEGCGKKKEEHRGKGDTKYCLDGGMFEPNWTKCRGYRPAFIESFIMRLSRRYYEERQRQESVTTALVRFDRSDKAVEEFLKDVKDARDLKAPKIINRYGAKHGREAADKINLQPNVLTEEEKKKQQLT